MPNIDSTIKLVVIDCENHCNRADQPHNEMELETVLWRLQAKYGTLFLPDRHQLLIETAKLYDDIH